MAAVPADLASPPATLAALTTTGLIDFTAPACLILALVLHFKDASTARKIVSAYVSALAPGSYVLISAGRGEAGIGEQVTQAYDAAPLYNHTPGDIAGFFTGLNLVHPGIADARAWRPSWPTPPPFKPRKGQILAGAGTKPRPARLPRHKRPGAQRLPARLTTAPNRGNPGVVRLPAGVLAPPGPSFFYAGTGRKR